MKKFTLSLFLAGLAIVVTAQKTPFTTEDAINVLSFSIQDVTEEGDLVAGLSSTRHNRFGIDHMRYRDPSYVSPSSANLVIMNGMTGEQTAIYDDPGIFRNITWSPDGKRLAFLKYEDERFNLNIYDVERSRVRTVKLRTDREIASNSVLIWTPGGDGIVLSFRKHGWHEKGDSMYTEATAGPVTVYDSKRPFLKWDEIRNHSSLNTLGLVDTGSRNVTFLLEENRYSGIRLSEDGNLLSFVSTYPLKTSYDNTPGAEYEMQFIRLDDPDKKEVLIKKSTDRIRVNWNPDNDTYAFIDSARIAVRSLYEEESRMLTRDTTEISGDDTSKVELSINRWSPDGKKILAASSNGYWLADAETGEMEDVYRFPEDREEAPAMSVTDWSPDGRFLYMTYSAKDKWERGLVKYDLNDKQMTELILDSNLYSGWRLNDSGERFIFQMSDGDLPGDYYSADTDFTDVKKLTDLNPWMRDRKISRSRLMSYRDSDGEELWGILYYPVDYEPGGKYPLVCEIYERFFSNGYRMSMQLIANEGYFAFRPSVNLIEGYPGEAWIKGITSGVNKLIEEGLVDENKIGVHGTSYGGYATSLLITQTDRFAAAINISGKVNIISFLGDSPRIGTRNYRAAERGQDRIGESLWDAPMRYFATTAVLHADRINTPHLLLTGEGDWNVPAGNTRELYYAMRRLGKEVVWVNYMNGGHGAGAASDESDFYDHWERILGWYETHFNKEE